MNDLIFEKLRSKLPVYSRWMQCEARSQVNQGESEGVDLRPRLKMSPLICQEIAHNAPPQVVFFTKNKTTPFIYSNISLE